MNRIIQIEWQQFINGDNRALASVYEANKPAMLLTAYYYLKDKEQAKDLIADVFTKLLFLSLKERKERLSDVNEKLDTFLKVLTKNKCLDFIKVQSNRKTILTGIFDRFSRSYTNSALLNHDFELMMDALPYRQKQILDLHLKGYKNDEICEQLNISYNTCRNTLSSAKKKIKQLWATFMD